MGRSPTIGNLDFQGGWSFSLWTWTRNTLCSRCRSGLDLLRRGSWKPPSVCTSRWFCPCACRDWLLVLVFTVLSLWLSSSSVLSHPQTQTHSFGYRSAGPPRHRLSKFFFKCKSYFVRIFGSTFHIIYFDVPVELPHLFDHFIKDFSSAEQIWHHHIDFNCAPFIAGSKEEDELPVLVIVPVVVFFF